MSAMPEQSQFGGIGVRPAAPAGAKRLWPWFKAATTKTVFIGLAVIVWQNVAPEPFKPSTLIGGLAAKIASAEINGTADAQVALQQRMNELNYNLQIRLVKEQTYIQQQMQNEGGLQQVTQLADIGCIGSMIVGGVANAYHNADMADGARNFAQGFCGVAQQAHVMLTAAQQEIMHGDITMAAAGFDGHHYSPDEVKPMLSYFKTLPKEVQLKLVADNASDDVIGDRVLILYNKLHQS